jgi:hypothetical protein
MLPQHDLDAGLLVLFLDPRNSNSLHIFLSHPRGSFISRIPRSQHVSTVIESPTLLMTPCGSIKRQKAIFLVLRLLMKLIVTGEKPSFGSPQEKSSVHIARSRDDTRKESILACDHFEVEWVVILLSGNVSYKLVQGVVIYLVVFVAEKLTNTAPPRRATPQFLISHHRPAELKVNGLHNLT